jgi:hypothetical protein
MLLTDPNNGENPSTPRRRARTRTRGDRLLMTVLVGITLGLGFAFVLGTYAPKSPWAFDDPRAKLPSLQARHTLY